VTPPITQQTSKTKQYL